MTRAYTKTPIPIGTKFNMLTIQSEFSKISGKKKPIARRYVVCLCDCGNTTTLLWQSVKSGHTTSCGCYNKTKDIIHGESHTPLNDTWQNIKKRCFNSKSTK